MARAATTDKTKAVEAVRLYTQSPGERRSGEKTDRAPAASPSDGTIVMIEGLSGEVLDVAIRATRNGPPAREGPPMRSLERNGGVPRS
jgi:hypothetical protein